MSSEVPTRCLVNWRPSRTLTPGELTDEAYFHDMSNRPTYVNSMSDAQKCDLIRQHSWDTEWLERVQVYFRGLKDRATLVVTHYTHQGDRLVNMWLRGNNAGVIELLRSYDTFPFAPLAWRLLERTGEPWETYITDPPMEEGSDGNMQVDRDTIFADIVRHPEAMKAKMTDEFLLMVVAEAARILEETIKNAPALTRDVLLFRGVQTDMFQNAKTLEARGFVSTSNSGVIASEFAGKGGFVWRIHVPFGTHCLPIFQSRYDELEAILLPGTVLHQQHCVPHFAEGWFPGNDVKLCDVELATPRGVKRTRSGRVWG